MCVCVYLTNIKHSLEIVSTKNSFRTIDKYSQQPEPLSFQLGFVDCQIGRDDFQFF